MANDPTDINDWTDILEDWDDGWWEPDEDAADLTVDEARDAWQSTMQEFDEADILAMFPPRDIAITVAEQVDDIAPDIPRASIEATREALTVIARGLDRCAYFKRMTEVGAFAKVERKLKAEIREEKRKLLGVRRDVEARKGELEREAKQWRDAGMEAPTGFAAMFAKPGDAAEAARRENDRRKLVKDTNDFVRKTHESIMKQRADSFRKQNEEFLRRMRGSRW